MIKIIIVLITTILITGCTSRYMPHSSFAPLLSEKGEFTSEVVFSPSSFHGGIAFAPVNHLAVRFTGSITYKEPLGFSSPYFFPFPGKREYIESGIGFFTEKNKMIYELYGGMGFAETKFGTMIIHSGTSENGTTHGNFSGKYTLPYIQFNTGKKGRIVDFGGSVLFSSCYYHIEGEGDYGYVNKDINILAFEPNAYFRIGNKNIKWEIKGGILITDRLFYYENETSQTTILHFSTGLILNFNLYNKNKKLL